MLKITLKFAKKDENGNYIIDKNGQVKITEKTYANAFVTTKMYRETLEIQKTLNEIMDEELTDRYLQYICNMYHNQFDINDLYEGLPTNELFTVLSDTIGTVINMTFGLSDKENDEMGNENEKK